MSRLLSVLIASLVLACGGSSGGGAPAADETKTPAQVEEQAQAMEPAALEQTVSAYESKIEELGKEVDGLKAKLADKLDEVAGELGGLLGGDGAASDKIKQEAEALQEQLSQLEGRWKDLVAKLNIYIKELESRTQG